MDLIDYLLQTEFNQFRRNGLLLYTFESEYLPDPLSNHFVLIGTPVFYCEKLWTDPGSPNVIDCGVNYQLVFASFLCLLYVLTSIMSRIGGMQAASLQSI